jgi:6-phosphofructokinase 1
MRQKMEKKIETIGLLTGGGDCPGLNAVIRAVAKAAMQDHNLRVIGFEDGFLGLIENRWCVLSWESVSGILTAGGTILGTSNKANPFRHEVNGQISDVSDRAIAHMKSAGCQALICIGGDGTLSIAKGLMDKGVNLVGVPKTIDNDICCTDRTFGFDSAVATAVEAIDKLHTTAQSHHRVMVIEVMGRYSGWIALEAGVAGGADVILIPELPYDLAEVCKVVRERNTKGKRFSIVAIAEGAYPKGGDKSVKKIVPDSPDPIRLGGIGARLASDIERETGLETRVTVLGHLQRGGSPTAFDRVLATRYGTEAVDLVMQGRFGTMVSLQGSEIVAVPISDAIADPRNVPVNSPLIRSARSVGTSFAEAT